MTKVTFLMGLALLAVCPMIASAQMPDPVVPEGMFSYYDFSALKGGEWIQYETTSEMVMAGVPPNPTKSGYKIACVGVEGDTVYLETDQLTSWDATKKDFVVMVAVDKKTGNATKAWMGKAGEAGKEITVQKADPNAKPYEAPKFEGSGTGKVSKESIKVGAGDFDCEKVETNITSKANGMESKTKNTMWNSEKFPFKYKAATGETKDPYDGKVKWEGKQEGKGGMIKMVSENEGTGYTMKSTTELKGSGTDAKMSLKK